MHHIRRTQEAVFERITVTIATEYKRELARVVRSSEQRRRELVQRLLLGDPVEAAELEYDLDDAWHLGVIATGATAERAVRDLADGLALHLLSVPSGEGLSVWAWLGGRHKLAIIDIERRLSSNRVAGVSMVVGEPGKGIGGWRETHFEAQAALLVASRKPQRLIRCSDVPLEAAVLGERALTKSLMRSYLSPLDNLRMGGVVARETLRHYFECERNASSAAHSLGVTRHTVKNRLSEIEKILGRPIQSCLAELEVALRLEALGETPEQTYRPCS